MNISLPQELKDYVEGRAKGSYSTPSEFIRDLIRHDQKLRAKENLEQLLLEGLDSGKPIPTDKAFWADLKNEALGLIATQQSTAPST